MRFKLFDWRNCLVPLLVTRTKIGGWSYVGFMVVRVFGLCVAVVQLTNPWSGS